MNGMERQTIRSAGLFRWISTNQADIGSEYDHGWWSSMEFLQLLSHDFTDFEFDVISSFLMTTPPPSSTLPMPLVSARSTSLQIIFKEDWLMEPFYTVTVQVGFPGEVILLGILAPIDPENKWLLQNFPCAQLYYTNLTEEVLLPFPARSEISIFCTRYFKFSPFRRRPELI
jgi:hypothetical protein